MSNIDLDSIALTSQKDKIGQLDIIEMQKEDIDSGDIFSATRKTIQNGGEGISTIYPYIYNNFNQNDSMSSITSYASTDTAGLKQTADSQYIAAEKRRIDSQKQERAYLRSEGSFGLGTVYLDIPPTQISVSTEAHNFRYSSLRSPGEVVVSSGRSTTRIDLQIMFNGFEDINNNLRSLIAQLKTTPFLPMENDYLKKILNPFNKQIIDYNYLGSKKSQLKEMQKMETVLNNLLKTSSGIGELNSKTKEKINRLNKMGYLDEGAYNILMANVDNIQDIPPDALEKNDWKKDENGKEVFDMENYLRKNIRVPLKGNFDMISVERDLTEVKDLRDEIAAMEKKSSEYDLAESLGERFRDKQLVGVLSQISVSTVPNFPETLSCNLSLYVFNYDPFSLDFSFISSYNPDRPTPDITKCELFIEWYTKRWLVPRSDPNKMSLGLYSGDQKVEFTYITKMEPANTKSINNAVDVQKTSFSIDGAMHVIGMTMSMRNQIQFLPVLSSKNPTCQYLGSMNSDVQITIECTDDAKLSEFCMMLEKVGILARTQNRMTRNSFVSVSNGLLSLMGMGFFSISDYSIDTVPGNPGLSNIVLNLIEYKPGQEKFQSLKREGVTSHDQVVAAAEWILDEARKAVLDRKLSGNKEYFMVLDEMSGWFNKKTNIVESFMNGIGGDSTVNDDLRKKVFSKCEEVPFGEVLKNSIGIIPYTKALYGSMSSPPIAGALRSVIDTGRVSPGITFKYGMGSDNNYSNNKDYVKYGKQFKQSIADSDGSFFESNKKTIAEIAAIVKRSDITNKILEINSNPALNEHLNDKKNSYGENLRNKEDQDAGKVSAYPDLDLPRYKDIPDGYKFMNTLKKIGSPLADKNTNKSAQSLACEADPDFFMWKGSVWDHVGSDQKTGDAIKAGIRKYQELGLSNQRFRRNEALDENVLTQFLVDKQRGKTEERYVFGFSSVNPEQKKVLESKPVIMKTGSDNPHDGDTMSIIASDGKSYSVRLDGYDAPEIKDSDNKKVTDLKHAKMARDYLSSLVSGKELIIEVSRSDVDLYQRPIVNVWISNNGTRGKWVNEEMLKKSKELNLSYLASADNPYDLNAQQTYLRSHENYLHPLTRDNSKRKYEVQSVVGAALLTNPLVAGGTFLYRYFSTPPEQVESRAMDDTGIAVQTIARNSLGLANFIFPENWITNDLDAVVAKAITTRTNNRNLFRFDREARKNIELTSSKILESQKDDTLRMSRAFPTFKVYFIEEDMPEWGRLDDEYSYQGVSSIDITKSRQEAADVAVLTLFNTKGTLDRSLFGLYDKDGRYIVRENLESYDPVKQETKAEQTLDEFVLKVGTVIKIKMGYSADPDILDTVFTGMVAEVNGGDMITIVAQGFGVELLNKVPQRFFCTEAASAFKVLDRLITSPSVVHFGKWTWFPRASNTSKVLFRRYEQDQKTGKLRPPSVWRRIGGIDFLLGLADDTRNNNIWVPENSFAYNLTHGGLQTFITQDKTIWDCFKDMERRYPGYIATVLPFDNRSTIYFGPADFMYWYTDKNREEKSLWEKGEYDSMHITDSQKLSDLVKDKGYKEMTSDDFQKMLDGAAQYLTWLMNDRYSNNKGLQEKVRLLVTAGYRSWGSDTEPISKVSSISTMGWVKPNGSYTKLGEYADRGSQVASFLKTIAQSDLGTSVQDARNKEALDFIVRHIENPSGDAIYARIVRGPAVISNSRTFEDKIELKYESPPVPFGMEKKQYISPEGKMFSKQQAIDQWNDVTHNSWSELDQSRKLVRQYHFKDSYHHIIANNIIATSQYMYNKVTVEYGNEAAWAPGKLWESNPGFHRVSAQIDDDIWPEKIRERIVQERNAKDVVTAWNYSLGNLWNETRKMYSGHLVLLGDGSIKPYDIMMISDYFTDMFGPIEVEQVTHHFSADTGFITTIVPNLMCYINNNMQQGSTTIAGIYSNSVSDFVQNIRGRVPIPMVEEQLGQIAFWFTGLSTGRREPISFSPLIYAGRPFIAGIEGLKKNGLIESSYNRLALFMINNNRITTTTKAVYDLIWTRANDQQYYGG